MRDLLLHLAEADRRLRAQLALSGEVFAGYHPDLRALHDANARELELLIDEDGWPSIAESGEDGVEAAFLIAMHAISRPAFQRRSLTMMKAAALRGEIPPRHPAMMEDRIRALEGRPQLYGTQLDWDENGLLSPLPCQDDDIDARRAKLGLPPLAEAIAAVRARAAEDGELPPADWSERQQAMDAFARTVGWR